MKRVPLLLVLLPLAAALAGPGTPCGVLPAVLDELSGLAASRRAPDLFWANNDSGDTNRIYAIDRQAHLRAIVVIAGFVALDWEDMAAGVDSNGTPWLFVAETGDNFRFRSEKRIAAFPEPVLPADGVADLTVTNAQIIHFMLPKGESVDIETLAYDAAASGFIVCTKEKHAGRVYTIPWSTAGVQTAQLVGTVSVVRATGGDLTADGRKLAIRDLRAIHLWTRAPGEAWSDVLLRAPVDLPVEKEDQGEAFAWLPDGKAYVTSSEKKGSQLFFYGE